MKLSKDDRVKPARTRTRPAPKVKLVPLESKQFDITAVAKVFKTLPLDVLRPSIFQTRKLFKPKAMKELEDSLAATGINFNPVIVRPVKSGEGYEIICGERRWRSACKAGLPVLLCCVGDFTDEQALYLGGVDNIQREALTCIEEAQAYELMINSGMSHAALADDVGRTRGHISNYLRLLTLPLKVRDYLGDERLSFAQARALCSLTNKSQQIEIATSAAEKGWTAKKVEAAVAQILEASRKRQVRPPVASDVNVDRLMHMVSEQTGYPCVIRKNASGTWQIGFNAGTLDEFHGILDRLRINTEEM